MDSKPSVIHLTGSQAVAIRTRVPHGELAHFLDVAFAELETVAGRQVSGPPFALFYETGPDDVDVAAAVPTWSRVEPVGRIEPLEVAGGIAVKVEHVGTQEELAETYALLESWLAANERTRGGPRREVYLTMPMAPPSEQITIVIQPLVPVKTGAPEAHIDRMTRHSLRGAPISK